MQHRHHETLRQYWLRELDHPKMQLTAGELEAAIEASYGNDDEGQLWNLLTDRWDGHAEDRLIVRLVEGHDNSGVRVSALDCLAGHVPDEIKKYCLDAYRQQGQRQASRAGVRPCPSRECWW